MMRVVVLACFCLLLTCHTVRGVPKKTLSDEPHEKDGEHNSKYDHEAFLGKEGAAEFDNLSPEESKRRLRLICDKIDTDDDGFITHDELAKWVDHVFERQIVETARTYFKQNDKDNDGKVLWEELKKSNYGTAKDPEAIYDSSRGLTFKKAIERDEKRFKVCDKNNDGSLDVEEYGAFLHPESFEHTKQIHVDESFADMDRNKDGKVAVEEYIDHIWPRYERENANGEEPDWVKDERKHFSKTRDTDGDNMLSKRELADWINPKGYDPAKAEASHLIHHADSDKDKKLSISEVIDNHSLFVGSHATEFGGYLKRHDEF